MVCLTGNSQCHRVGSCAFLGTLSDGRTGNLHDNASASVLVLPDGSILAAAARLDYRPELYRRLNIDAVQGTCFSDSVLLARSYLMWGEDCVEYLHGDWSFAVFEPASRNVLLARDQHGNSSLYYSATDRCLAFSSSRKALLALNRPELRQIDDLYVTQLLLSWPVYHGERTAHTFIRRLPPAHTFKSTATTTRTRRYWRLEDVEPLPIKSLDEAVEGFLPIFDAAVAGRLSGAARIATCLSSGLDSGSVTATAAHLLQATGTTVSAYTSCPANHCSTNIGGRVADEWQLASLTAARFPNIHHYSVDAAACSPLAALRESLLIHDEPQHAAGNAFWMLELARTARTHGCTVLLTGQSGNAGISWTGNAAAPVQGQSMRTRARQILLNALPRRTAVDLAGRWIRWRMAGRNASLAIHPRLLDRTDTLRASLGDSLHPFHIQKGDGSTQRLAMLKPGRTIVGCRQAEIAAASGIGILDPTADIRVLSYCLALPGNIWSDRETQLDRMLIRTAMRERLPDAVRLNRRRGLQSADLIFRLRADRTAMENCLGEMRHGPARDYLHLPRLHQAWTAVLERDDLYAHREASVVLLRALMVGLFVNSNAIQQQYSGSPASEAMATAS